MKAKVFGTVISITPRVGKSEKATKYNVVQVLQNGTGRGELVDIQWFGPVTVVKGEEIEVTCWVKPYQSKSQNLGLNVSHSEEKR